MADPTREQLMAALRRADAAGDTAAARAIARRLAPTKPDFSNVQAGSSSTEAYAPTAPPPSLLDRAGRELGLGARGLIRAGYGLSGLLGGDIASHLEGMARGVPTETGDQSANRLADALGLPKPETASERIGGDITSAVGAGGGLIGGARQLAARAPGVLAGVGEALASQPGLQLAGNAAGTGAASATREAGGGQGVQLAAGLVGGLAPATTQTAGSALVRGIVRGGEAGRRQVERTLADFRSVGATPSVGQATGRKVVQGAENLLAASPASAGVMGRFAENQAADIGAGLQARGAALAPSISGEKAGRALKEGAETFAGNVGATRKALYWRADKLMPPSTTLPMTRTYEALADLTTPNLGAPNTTGALINPKIAALAENVRADLRAAPDGLPYEAVKAIRSRIGEALSDYSLTTDKPTAEYKRLYAALSQDMEEAARRAGPDAERAAKRANTYFRASADRLETLDRVVTKAGGPEAVYNAALSGTKDGATTLRAVMRSVPPDARRALTGAVVKRMGMAAPGAQDASGELFSAQTFLTNWNKLSPEARATLFDTQGPKFAADMDKVARVAANVKDGSKVFANPSGTANRAAALGYYGSLAGSLLSGQGALFAGLAGAGAGSNVLARAMTSPAFVRWLSKATEMPVSALPQQVVVLHRMGTLDPDVAAVADALQQSGQGQPEASQHGRQQ